MSMTIDQTAVDFGRATRDLVAGQYKAQHRGASCECGYTRDWLPEIRVSIMLALVSLIGIALVVTR